MQEKVSQRIGGFDDPKDVAVFGIQMMEQGMISGVPGLKNKAKEFMKRMLPERIWLYLIKKHMTHSLAFCDEKVIREYRLFVC